MADTTSKEEFFLELDVGNLCVTNIVQLKSAFGKDVNEEILKHVAAHGAQQLLNEILKLPSEYHQNVPVAKLPEPTTVIPREKHVPKPKPMTKWEKFAKEKGIQRRKKDKLSWDDNSKNWKPQYGYRSGKSKDDWLIEIPPNADPNVDYFGKVREEKKEKVAKNEYKRLRNIATAAKMKVTNLESVDKADKQQLARSLTAAKSATASIGRFADRLPKERPPKNSMKKRQFKANAPTSLKDERENCLKIFESLNKKEPKLNVEEAVQKYIGKPRKQNAGSDQKKKKSNRSKFIKNLYRGGKKKKTFRKE